jgi:hypothetical protein
MDYYDLPKAHRKVVADIAAKYNMSREEVWLIHKATWKTIKAFLSEPADHSYIRVLGLGTLRLMPTWPTLLAKKCKAFKDVITEKQYYESVRVK